MAIVGSNNPFLEYYQDQRPNFQFYCWQMICNNGMKIFCIQFCLCEYIFDPSWYSVILSPCNTTSNVVTFSKSSNRFSLEWSLICSQYLSNISSSRKQEYFGYVLWVGGLITWYIFLRIPQMLVDFNKNHATCATLLYIFPWMIFSKTIYCVVIGTFWNSIFLQTCKQPEASTWDA